MSTVALIGKPNTGKTSLFNLLTGMNQRVANFMGTTVEKAEGPFTENKNLKLIDLPGAKSLFPQTTDELISWKYLLEGSKKETNFSIICVTEASNLKSDLVLPLLLKDMGFSVSIVINMIDESNKNGIKIDFKKLSQKLEMKCLGISVKENQGIDELKKAISENHLVEKIRPNTGIEVLENSKIKREKYKNAYTKVRTIIADSVIRPPETILATIQQAINIDKWLMHPISGPIIFTLVMIFIFQSVFTWANPLIDIIDGGFGALASWAIATIPNEMLGQFIGDGLITGLGSVLVFLPQIAILFALIGFFERVGYLPRAAVMMDKLFKPLGLDGRVFIPLLSSYACAIPGIMAARTIDSEKKRLLTIMIAPLMTCSARLPVYTLIIAAFIPKDASILGLGAQGATMAGLYIFSIFMAVIVGFIFKHFNLYEKNDLHIVNLPPYRLPKIKEIIKYVSTRCLQFTVRVGRIIFVLAIILWVISAFPKLNKTPEQMGINTVGQSLEKIEAKMQSLQIEHSILGRIGKTLEPVFSPLGYDWKISIAVITSLAAREVFVGTMGLIYSLGADTTEESKGLIHALRSEKKSDGSLAYNMATAVSLLLFFAIALQCISTLAIVKRETNSYKWMLAQFSLFSVLAYVFAFAGYRITLFFM